MQIERVPAGYAAKHESERGTLSAMIYPPDKFRKEWALAFDVCTGYYERLRGKYEAHKRLADAKTDFEGRIQ